MVLMPAPTPHERLAARARRVAALRRGVIASACASFALGWAVIAYDGSMGVESASTSAAATTQVESSSTESGSIGRCRHRQLLHPVRRQRRRDHGPVLMGEHFFWITSRAAGLTTLLAATAAVALGLLMGGRLAAGRRRGDLKTAHEALSLIALVALAVHALALLGDGYLSPSLADLTIPLVSDFKRVWTTTGIVAGWLLVLLGLSYYVRGRIGPARWKRLHRFTALAWLLGVIHALGEGTDAGAAWFLGTVAAVVLPTLALLVVRLGGRPRAALRPQGRAPLAGGRDAARPGAAGSR